MIALRTAGKSKRSIAKELGIDRKTVDNVLDVFQADQPNYATTIRELTTKAFVRVANSIENEKDTDTARWALERTVFKPEQGQSYQFNGDVSLSAVTALMPSPSTPSLPSTTSSPTTLSTTSTSDRSSREGPPDHLELSIHPNFSTFSTDQIRAELARREAAPTVLDAEVVDAP